MREGRPDAIRAVSTNAAATLGLVLLLMLVLVALMAPTLAPDSPATQNLREDLRPPSRAHLFGQDKLGRDVLSRVIYGARVSLVVGVVVVGISAIVGLGIGGLAGYAVGTSMSW